MLPPWKKNLYFIWVAVLCAIAGFGTSNPIIPFYVQSLGISDPDAVKLWAGLIQTAGSLSVALFAPIWGKLADQFGRRVMFLRALLGGAAMMLAMGLSRHPWQLLLFRGLGGMFTGTVAAATVLVATTVPKEEAASSLGFLHTAILIGAAGGPMIGGVVSDLLGYRAMYCFTSALLLGAAFIVLRFVKEQFLRRPRSGPLWRNLAPDFSMLIHSPQLLILVLVVGSVQLANSVLVPILPLFIRSLTPDSALIGSTAGVIVGMRAFAGTVAAASIGRISGRLGTRRVLIVCLLGAALSHFPLMLVGSTWQLLVLRFTAGVFLGGTIPAVNALIALRSDRDSHGAVYGISSSFSSAGSATGPVVGAAIAAIWSFDLAFAVVGFVLMAIGALVLAFLARDRLPPPGRAAARGPST